MLSVNIVVGGYVVFKTERKYVYAADGSIDFYRWTVVVDESSGLCLLFLKDLAETSNLEAESPFLNFDKNFVEFAGYIFDGGDVVESEDGDVFSGDGVGRLAWFGVKFDDVKTGKGRDKTFGDIDILHEGFENNII